VVLSGRAGRAHSGARERAHGGTRRLRGARGPLGVHGEFSAHMRKRFLREEARTGSGTCQYFAQEPARGLGRGLNGTYAPRAFVSALIKYLRKSFAQTLTWAHGVTTRSARGSPGPCAAARGCVVACRAVPRAPTGAQAPQGREERRGQPSPRGARSALKGARGTARPTRHPAAPGDETARGSPRPCAATRRSVVAERAVPRALTGRTPPRPRGARNGARDPPLSRA
jgi:hypothetical protein